MFNFYKRKNSEIKLENLLNLNNLAILIIDMQENFVNGIKDYRSRDNLILNNLKLLNYFYRNINKNVINKNIINNNNNNNNNNDNDNNKYYNIDNKFKQNIPVFIFNLKNEGELVLPIKNWYLMNSKKFNKDEILIYYIEKKTNDAFSNSIFQNKIFSLNNKLKEFGIQNLIIMGMNASICVRDTINSALKYKYNVYTSSRIIQDSDNIYNNVEFKKILLKTNIIDFSNYNKIKPIFKN